MTGFNRQSVPLIVVWLLGLATLAVPGVLVCTGTVGGGLLAATLPLLASLGTLAAIHLHQRRPQTAPIEAA